MTSSLLWSLFARPVFRFPESLGLATHVWWSEVEEEQVRGRPVLSAGCTPVSETRGDVSGGAGQWHREDGL